MFVVKVCQNGDIRIIVNLKNCKNSRTKPIDVWSSSNSFKKQHSNTEPFLLPHQKFTPYPTFCHNKKDKMHESKTNI